VDPVRRLVEALLRFGLQRSFREVCWVGDWPPALPEGPTIAYANHHHFYDGHLAWLLFREWLDRPPTLWMADWDRAPFFAAVGAQPFPDDDPERRAATLRRTARRFRDCPRTILIYYPEGTLHSPDEGLLPFETSTLRRLARLYPDAQWWPYAVHVTWKNEATPTALLAGGTPHEVDGTEEARLNHLWSHLKEQSPHASKTLLHGHRGFEERWDLSRFASFFERYL
jgi:hypothetical protein